MRRTPRTRALLTSILAAIVALTIATPGVAGAAAGFGDVEDGEYYTDAVAWLVGADITTGIEPGCFGPHQYITRGQVAAFLHRLDVALGNDPKTGHHPFTDVRAPYQQEPVGWLYRNELTTGVSAQAFAPQQSITRGDFAVLMWRYAGAPRTSEALPFADVKNAYQRDAVAWMADEGITTGTSARTFSPNGLVTRAQAAAFLFRFVDPEGAAPTSDSKGCTRSLRITLQVGGLSAGEARCAAPYLTDFDIDYLVDVLSNRASADMDLLVAAATVGNRCLTSARIADLARLFF